MKPKNDIAFNILMWNVRSIRSATKKDLVFNQLNSFANSFEAIHLIETHLDQLIKAHKLPKPMFRVELSGIPKPNADND